MSSLVDRRRDDDEGDGYLRRHALNDEGVNIVLFAHAAAVVGDCGAPAYNIARIDKPFSSDNPFLGDGQYVERTMSDAPADEEIEYPIVGDAIEAALEIFQNEIVICEVRGIRHDFVSHRVTFISKGEQAEAKPDFLF